VLTGDYTSAEQQKNVRDGAAAVDDDEMRSGGVVRDDDSAALRFEVGAGGDLEADRLLMMCRPIHLDLRVAPLPDVDVRSPRTGYRNVSAKVRGSATQRPWQRSADDSHFTFGPLRRRFAVKLCAWERRWACQVQ